LEKRKKNYEAQLLPKPIIKDETKKKIEKNYLSQLELIY
jgi:hypothetical protein